MVHNSVADAVHSLVRSWGLATSRESREYLGGHTAKAMDMLVHAAGVGGTPLAIDFTRIVGASLADLTTREAEKEKEYGSVYTFPVTLRGWAIDEFGRGGPSAHHAAGLLVTAAARAGAGDPQDLHLELAATVGVALARAHAANFAHFGYLNGDHSLHVPTREALAPGVGRHAGGARFGGTPSPPTRARHDVTPPPQEEETSSATSGCD